MPIEFHQLVEEALVGLAELAERSEFDDRLHVIFEQRRQDVDVGRLGMAEPRADADEVRRRILEQDRPLVRRRLSDQSFAQAELLLQLVCTVGAIARGELELGLLFLAGRHIEHAILRVHQRRELGHDQVRHCGEVAFALQHAAEAGEVGLEPVLLGVLQRLILEVADHLVDRVLEGRHFTRRLDGDGSGEVALGHSRRHVGDRPDLVGKVRGELVHVVREVAPQAGGTRHPGLSA